MSNPHYELNQIRKGKCKCGQEIISLVHWWWQIREQIEYCMNCHQHTVMTKNLDIISG